MKAERQSHKVLTNTYFLLFLDIQVDPILAHAVKAEVMGTVPDLFQTWPINTPMCHTSSFLIHSWRQRTLKTWRTAEPQDRKPGPLNGPAESPLIR